MEIITDWFLQYLNRNYTDVLQGLIFAAVTLLLVFKDADTNIKIRSFFLSFLVSYNTAEIFSYGAYAVITSSLCVKGTFWDLLLATACLLLPVFILIPLYAKVIAIT